MDGGKDDRGFYAKGKGTMKNSKAKYVEMMVYKNRDQEEIIGMIRFDMLNEPRIDLKDCFQNFVISVENLSVITPYEKGWNEYPYVEPPTARSASNHPATSFAGKTHRPDEP